MMRAGSAPSSASFDDALALVRMAADPEALQEAISGLKEASEKYKGLEQRHAAVSAKERELEKREAALAEAHSAVTRREDTAAERHSALAERESHLALSTEAHTSRAAALDAREQEIQDGHAALATAQELFHKVAEARNAALDARETEISAREAALADKHAKLKELIAG